MLPTDLIVVVLNLQFGFLFLLFGVLGNAEAWGSAVFYFLAAPGVLLLVRYGSAPRNRLLGFLRIFYVQLFYIFFFTDCIRLSQYLYGGRSLDRLFLHLEELLFGFQPALLFSELLSASPVVNELFFFSYFFYYALIVTGPWILFFRGERLEAIRGLFLITGGFAILYLFYILFPVHGPKYAIESLRQSWYSEFSGFVFTSIMTTIFENTNLAGAAFPSSHVAMATAALLFNRKHNPGLAAAFVLPTLLLCFSTVYIYAHYAVDVLAGIPVGLAVYYCVPRLWGPVDRLAGRLEKSLPGFGA
ncbi:MAG: phosphatase PAP2 family protein [Spirochaetota bacterium]